MWPFPETPGHISHSEFQVSDSIQRFLGERGKLRDVLLWIYTVGHGGPQSVISKAMAITPLTGVMATYRVCNSIYNWKGPTLYPPTTRIITHPPLYLPLLLAGNRGGIVFTYFPEPKIGGLPSLLRKSHSQAPTQLTHSAFTFEISAL